MENTPAKFSLTDPAVQRRFGVALACSLLLHGVLFFGVRVVPDSSPEEPTQAAISVRLADAPSFSPPKMASTTVAAAERPSTEKRAEVAQPAPSQPPSAVSSPPPPSSASSQPTVNLPLAEDPTFYPAAKLDVHPQALRKIQPAYPSAAAEAGVQGEVTVLLLIDEYGVVKDASVADAKPEGWFEDATLDAVKDVRFRPAERNGRIVKSRVLIRVSYELNGAAPRRQPAR